MSERLAVVRAGFIPLLDAAVLIAAATRGFDRAEGVRLELVREVSWSNIRDRLAFRQFDAAHMLGPMAVAGQLGLGSNPVPVIAPFALGTGGNAVTLSLPLFRRMRDAGEAGADSAAHGRALARVIAERRARGEPPLAFGVTYPFSSHNYEFRFWMAQAGIDPDRDVAMTVVPPPMTADALRAGAIDGFCVNAPWNVEAVAAGVGRIVAVKADIWPGSPEKVLGLRPEWWDANRETGEALLRALHAAAVWCDAPENRDELAGILAAPTHVGGDAAAIARILAGDLAVDPDGTRRALPGYLAFHQDFANFPWRSQALWVYAQMARWGQVPFSEALAGRAAQAFRPDLFRAVLGERESNLPASDERTEAAPGDAPPGTADFDPTRIDAYLRGFAVAAGPKPDPARFE